MIAERRRLDWGVSMYARRGTTLPRTTDVAPGCTGVVHAAPFLPLRLTGHCLGEILSRRLGATE